MKDLVPALEAVIQEHVDPFIKESRAALADDAAGRQARVVALEPMLLRLGLALIRVVVAHMADELGGGKVRNSHACQCGGSLRYKVTRERAWGTLVGELLFDRAYHRCAKCKATRYPLEVVWGLRPAEEPAKSRCYLTPEAGRRLALLSAVMSYGQASKQFVQSGLRVSAMLAWRTVKRVGKGLRAEEAASGVKVWKGAVAGKGRQALRWLISADGIMVGFWRDARRRPRKEGAPEVKRRKGIDWKEVKVAVVAILDEKGDVVRGSQWYMAGMMPAKAFRRMMWQVAQARGVRAKDIVAVVTDGAKWLRALVTRHFTWAVGIRDFYHASEHLKKMAEALYGEGTARAKRWHGRMAHRLKRGEINVMLAEWEKMKPKDEKTWKREYAYFETQREAMAYGKFQDEKLPIGSGCMEASCKTVVTERHKISGARWTEEGFLNLNAVRLRLQNGQPLA